MPNMSFSPGVGTRLVSVAFFGSIVRVGGHGRPVGLVLGGFSLVRVAVARRCFFRFFVAHPV